VASHFILNGNALYMVVLRAHRSMHRLVVDDVNSEVTHFF